MRILIAGDHPIVRKGVRETLLSAFTACEFIESDDGLEAYSYLTTETFDLAIVEVFMPGKNGVDLVKDVLSVRPQTRFLVLSACSECEFALRAYRNGAMGCLDNTEPLESLEAAAKRILSGKKYVSLEYAELLIREHGGERRREDRLSDRELCVIRSAAAGRRLSSIASELNLSVKTVSTYKTRAMEKLGISDNVELVVYASRRGWIREKQS